MYSSIPPVKNFKQNIAANIRPNVKQKGKYSESLEKLAKQNTVINQNKVEK